MFVENIVAQLRKQTNESAFTKKLDLLYVFIGLSPDDVLIYCDSIFLSILAS